MMTAAAAVMTRLKRSKQKLKQRRGVAYPRHPFVFGDKMEKTKFRLSYDTSAVETVRYPVIVVAAGSSSRMQGVNKQLAELDGIPVIIRTLRVFDESPFISRIILVTREEDIPLLQRLVDEYSVSRLTDIVAGGSDRHSSVMCGLSRLAPDEEKVLIHDGARPLVNDFVIGNVTAALANEAAVICAVPICDTVKRADENGFVGETVDRTRLYSVQTPQGVSVPEYRAACETVADAALLTDDAALMEAAGHKVRIVEGDVKNIKITAQKDLKLALLYLKEDL